MNQKQNDQPLISNEALMEALLAQGRLAALQEDELAEKAEQRKKQKDQDIAFRKATLENIRIKTENETALKEACPHMKPNFQPAVGGQRDHKGNYHFVCQYCNKEFHNNLPYHLQISGERVGGPQ